MKIIPSLAARKNPGRTVGAGRWIMLVSLAVIALAVEARAASTAPAGGRPNVLLIISDDQGYSDFGFTGNPLVSTPVLDRLAAQSAVFRNFVVAAACSPSRAAFYTGRDHLLTGVWGVPPRANLRKDEVLLPAYFRAAGYRTFYAGKADTARLPESSPWERGWDQGYFVSGYQHRDPTLPNRGATLQPKGWTADILTDLILDFIREKRPEPWLATAAYIIPHLPWVCDDRYQQPFLARGLSADLARCYGSIAQLDAAIGRLLAGLRETGQEENTLVVFVSDNGMSHKAEADRELTEADWAKRNPHALRGHKATVWENGIRVPFLVRWPGKIAPGDRRQFGGAEDLVPTLLDLAGVLGDAVAHLPWTGVSLRPALMDATAFVERTPLFRLAISGPGSPRDGIADARQRAFTAHHVVLRGPRFKYHALPGGQSALFDLDADPGETTDVQARFPQEAARLAAECRQRWDEIVNSGRSFQPAAEGASRERPAKAKRK
ncbi:MAG: sulfatase-like hydrolase/transferase [Verrucomicrobia bacterium]|nr:sulfatase-like hydrolase/transferase [Verrucomicrobiota bacterium]